MDPSLPADVTAALERARLQVEAHAVTADELQVALPDAVGSALRDGLREEAAPISRRLAVVKGLANQTIRRLERLETDLLAERHARVDDLALLVDLVTSQWRGLNERLDRIEAALEKNVPKEFIQDAHHWLILHGRYVCKARVPECWHCAIEPLCEYRPKTPPPAG